MLSRNILAFCSIFLKKWLIPADQVDKSASDGVAKMATRIGVSLLQQPNSWVLRYSTFIGEGSCQKNVSLTERWDGGGGVSTHLVRNTFFSDNFPEIHLIQFKLFSYESLKMCYFVIPSLLIVQHCSLALLASERERLGGFSQQQKHAKNDWN